MIVQGSPEWFDARRGKVTASRVADVMAKTKTGYSASRANYMAELLCERLTGTTAAGFSNDAMRWGTETEPQARAAYAFLHDVDVVEVGFVDHPTVAMSGASPDGLVGADGMVEIKCPNTSTHLDTLLGAPIKGSYVTQMQWQMACADRAWCDFVSFDPRLPEAMQLHVTRVVRDDAAIAEAEGEVGRFLSELAGKEAELVRRYGERKAA
jgi:putative phage-type endonuclease